MPSIDVSYAKENDPIARGFGLGLPTMAHGLGTLHYGIAFSRDIVEPVTNHLHLPKSENGYSLGWTQSWASATSSTSPPRSWLRATYRSLQGGPDRRRRRDDGAGEPSRHALAARFSS